MTSTPQRIVSLVPSETYNVACLGALDRLVGRTRYCVAPEEVDDIPVVGGTKDVVVSDVMDLEPDLVLANREENREPDVQALIDGGLHVRVVFPVTVNQGLDDFLELAEVLGVAGEVVDSARRARERGPRHDGAEARAFVPIWRNPWMTVNDDTYIGDVLRWLGLSNVFGQRPSFDEGGKDTRYPHVTLDEVREARPEVVLLPDEPYRFGSKHASIFEALGVVPDRVRCVSGRDLCWHGAWAVEGLSRLGAACP